MELRAWIRTVSRTASCCRWHDCKSIASKHPHGHEFFAFPTLGQYAGSAQDFGMWLHGIGYEHADIWAPITSAGSMLQLSEERNLEGENASGRGKESGVH